MGFHRGEKSTAQGLPYRSQDEFCQPPLTPAPEGLDGNPEVLREFIASPQGQAMTQSGDQKHRSTPINPASQKAYRGGSATAAAVPTTETEADLLLYPTRGCIARFAFVVSLMKGTPAMETPSQTDRGGMILIDTQQKFEKGWILKDGLAHNGRVFSWETKDSPLRGLPVKFFEGAQPPYPHLFCKKPPKPPSNRLIALSRQGHRQQPSVPHQRQGFWRPERVSGRHTRCRPDEVIRCYRI
jgi:hypothetical protein